jgi:TetR/AcrR family transcriptional regulator
MSDQATRTRMTGPERRAAILKAAASTFAQLGYRGATMADIAAAAGITQPMLYRHFTSKHELFLEVLDRIADPILERWQDAPDLYALGARYLEFSAQNQEVIRLRFHALAESNDPAIQERLRRSLERMTALVRAVVQRMRSQGQLPADASDEAVTWLFSALGQMVDVSLLLGEAEVAGALQGGHLFARLLKSAARLDTPGPGST